MVPNEPFHTNLPVVWKAYNDPIKCKFLGPILPNTPETEKMGCRYIFHRKRIHFTVLCASKYIRAMAWLYDKYDEKHAI